MKRFNVVRNTILPLLGVAMLLAAGCATGKATATADKLAVVEKAIYEAREGTAMSYAPLELKAAEDKFAAAQSAMKQEEYEVANGLADQAMADAEYARAKSASVKTRKMADDLTDSIKMLKDELERTPGK